MEITGSKLIPAGRDAIWARLTDPEALKSAIPGCREMTGSIADGFEAVVDYRLGPLKASFRGSVAVTAVDAPARYRLEGGGKGGIAGHARGTADVSLDEIDGGTQLTYRCEAHVGGAIEKLGGAALVSIARRMVDRFFDRLIGLPDPGDGS